MREIKFRACLKDKPKKGMMYDVGIMPHPNQNCIVNKGTMAHKLHEVHIMQFTGWIDKNKKEIYEGDICWYKNGLYQIVWGDVLGGFHQLMIPKHTGHFLQNQYMDRCEVVGNIYQNPELLIKK